ncbi:MAG: MFS transporter [Clostridium sp.]
MDKQIRPFGMRDKIGYMFGDFGNDFTFILSSAFMLKFYTDVMGWCRCGGNVNDGCSFLDAFTDITMGQIVDRSKPGKDGKFRPWIRRMCGPVAISSFLIYQSAFAGMPYWFKVGWMVVTYILWGSIFYTAVNIPYGSMASAISAEAKDRAQLSTWRTVGQLLPGS